MIFAMTIILIFSELGTFSACQMFLRCHRQEFIDQCEFMFYVPQ